MAGTGHGGIVREGVVRESAGRASAVQGGASRRQPAREPAARTYARALPVVPVRARGLTIEGADGRRYLDCVSGAGTLALGHNHPVVLEAIRAVLDSGAPLHVMDLTTPVEDAFVTELLRTLPPGLAARARVRFCGPTGTDPVATAVSLVRAATGRSRVIAVSDAPEPLPEDGGAERDRPAALLLEPVRSEAGVLPVADALVRRLRSRTAGQGVPLVVDETETGVGRTGAYWAFEHSGVTPDVLILAKAVGGSLPLAAVVHRDDLGDSGDSGGKDTVGRPAAAHTGATGAGAFRGNQLALAAGAATLAHVREQRLAEHAAALGERMLTRLRALAGEFACVGDVRGRGLMAGVELVSPDGTAHGPGDGVRRPGTGMGTSVGTGIGTGVGTDVGAGTPGTPGTPAELAAAVRRECLHRGLIVDVTGPCANVVRLLPPLIVTEEQMSAVLDRLFDAVRAVDRHRVGGPAALGGQHAPR